jgi:translation initiation factor IF-2
MVDKTTGEKRTVVESRKGNIIRRRRKGKDAEPKVQEPVVEAVEAEEVVAAVEESPTAEADALFAGEQSAAAEEVVVEEAVPAEEAEAVEVAASDEAEADQEATAESEEAVEAAAEVAADEADASVEVVEAKGDTEEADSDADTEAAGAAEKSPKKKTIGPKVLGKIELPQKKPRVVKKPKAQAQSASSGPDFAPEESEGGSGRDGKRWQKGAGKKRRSRKREFTSNELLDYEGRGQRRGGARRQKGGRRDEGREEVAPGSTEITTPKASKRIVKMEEAISVGEFARQMSLKASEVIQKLISYGVLATINQVVDLDTATVVAEDFGFQIEHIGFDESSLLEEVLAEAEAEAVSRSPVVTVMGHVDHGKTSLLDTIRKASVAAREHGGITQHIGAYMVDLEDGRELTFIDTPGHAAFTSMRARGANVTDIVVLVVAADDGVMPQTLEAIDHAKAAEVPIVVAVNKMDRPDANPDRVKQQLAERGLQPEDWGGDVMFYPVSALEGTGINELLEGILLVAEMKELTAVASGRAKGIVIEARQEKGRGTVATVLVQKGTLKVGDIFVSGAESGRVRSMLDHLGESLEEATPAVPAEISGFSSVPLAGDDFAVVESESVARQVAQHRAEARHKKAQAALAGGPISLEEFAQRTRLDAAEELNVIVKADVHGSLEAVRESVTDLSNDKVTVKVLHGGVGGVTESDVQLALASRAIIIGFNVRAEPRAMAEAESNGVDIRFYRVIYELIDDVKQAMAGLLAPVKKEVALGRVEVRDTFSVPKIGVVAGCYVLDGLARRGSFLRLLRDNVVVHEGKMLNLRRFKDDVKEVQSGYECGISIDGYNDIKTGDVMEIYEIQEEAATLD